MITKETLHIALAATQGRWMYGATFCPDKETAIA